MGRSVSTMAAAVLGMAEVLGGTIREPQHATVDTAMLSRAAMTEMTSRRAALSAYQERHDELDPAEGSGAPAAAPISSQNTVPEVSLMVGCLVDLEAGRQKVIKEMPDVGANEEQPCIWRVHPSIRETEPAEYNPMLVSIGPLHHGKERLEPMEKIKFRYLNKLLSRSPENKLDKYIKVICDCEPRARKQYATLEMDSDKFVKLLVLDGCFIIEYLVRREFEEAQELVLDGCLIIENLVKVKRNDQLVGVRWGFSHLKRDLMLLENQIPFFVLVKLFKESTIPSSGTHKKPLTDLLGISLRFLEIKLQKERELTVDQVLHLLHLHHKCLDPTEIPEEPRSWRQLALHPFKIAARLMSVLFFGILYLVLIHKWPCHCFRPTEESGVPNMIPCATELQKAGVKFRKKQKVNSYLEVSFTKEGTLEIPFLAVQESTSSKLRNFIALEQCCPQIGSHFTSYAAFMDNLINTQDDVSILQNRGIIESKLGSDREVAKLFNALCRGTQLDNNVHYNAPLFKRVKKFCEVPHHRWRASLRSTHFSSPWAAIAFIIGMIIFALAITQAYLNISRHRRK